MTTEVRGRSDDAGTVPSYVRRVAIANLVAQIGIVLTGGLVRLTGSGLGCPTWPQCVPGSYTPVLEQAEGYHSQVEFGNRMLTSVVSVAAIATAVVVYRRARRLRWLGFAPLIGVAAQAALGGVTVLTHLNPATVAAHFLLSMLLITVSAALVSELSTPVVWPDPPRPEVRWLVVALVVVLAVVLVLGTVVTGSGPHSGDADAPTRFGFDPRAVSWLHSDAVLVFCGILVALLLVLRLTGAPARVVQRTWWLVGATVAQGAIGYVQYATGLPEGLVALHMLGASLLVTATTFLVLAVGHGGRATATAHP